MNDIRDELIRRVYRLPEENFESLALDVFRYQSKYNEVYRSFLNYLHCDASSVESLEDIPCLPIRFFKSQNIQSGEWDPIMTFQSSGTTGAVTSKHKLREISVYKTLSFKAFNQVFGKVEDWCFLALLPHYLERSSSSLVQMVKMFIDESKYDQSGFYLKTMEDLVIQIQENQKSNIPTILIGVSFALIDLVEAYDVDMNDIIVMETGGMKGRRAEWDKDTLHQFLAEKLNVDKIHSEYGMTELLSQCYSVGDGIFQESPSMKIIVKELVDPFSQSATGKTGIVNVIDLGNIDTCGFIETEDLGIKLDEYRFKLKGRLDHSDIRGCNLMVV